MIVRWLRCNLQHLTAAWLAITVAAWFVIGWHVVALAVPAAVLLVLAVDAVARPASGTFYPTFSHGSREGDAVALSFDDGPDPEVTPKLLDLLEEERVHATFFVIARKLAAHPQLARRMRACGHAIGNHSWQHARTQNFWSARRHGRELDRAEQALESLGLASSARLYRPPVGLKSGSLAKAAHAHGLTIVAWSLHARDTRTSDPAAIARRVLDRVRPGDIILLHDGHDLPGRHRRHCVEAVRLILAGLRARRLRCVTVPELMGKTGA